MGLIQVKYRGKWMDQDEVDWARQQEAQMRASVQPPPIDVESLPAKADLESENPLADLGDKVPGVRRYITADGEIRSGLAPEEREIAQQILERYK